jgi:hypothetical protein
MGIKVVRITANFVEFEKQGNKWKQVVGEAPQASFWEQQQQSTPAQWPADTNKVKTDK